MSNSDDLDFREAYKNWAEKIEYHQHQIFLETAELVNMLKQKHVSAKTKNEIAIIVKGLKATTKSVAKVLEKNIH